MGSTLVRASRSANIKERGDLSCAVFDASGRLIAQAAHIPVHLGALEAAVDAARSAIPAWNDGDVVILNDPYAGGSHLPDLTTISPVFGPEREADPASAWKERDPEGLARAVSEPQAGERNGGAPLKPEYFLATRAHHSDIGGSSPGSLSIARDLFGEGLVLPPIRLARRGVIRDDIAEIIYANSRTPDERRGDLEAQVAAHSVGARRLADVMVATPDLRSACADLIDWSSRLAAARLRRLPNGVYRSEDRMDDDGLGGGPFAIRVAVTIQDGGISVDFSGTAAQAAGGINAPLAVTRSAVAYVVACLVGDAPINAGLFSRMSVVAPAGCLLAPIWPAPVAAGNVETSQRVVDVLLAALSQAAPELIPAASQGTMNNVLAGNTSASPPWAYYETIGGGSGASRDHDGASGIQVHMTNTRNTPIEALELEYPMRVERYALRRHSGGAGSRTGGDGIIRTFRFLEHATVSVIGERRASRPPGAAGGEPGRAGRVVVRREGQPDRIVPAKTSFEVGPGDLLEVYTPGGGGWGSPPQDPREPGDASEDPITRT